MDVLLINSRGPEDNLSQQLSDVLKAGGNQVSLHKIEDKSLSEADCLHSNNSPQQIEFISAFQVIIALDKIALHYAQHWIKKQQLPLVYILNISDFENSYPEKLHGITKIIVFNSTDSIKLLSSEMVEWVRIPFKPETKKNVYHSETKNILIVGEESKSDQNLLSRMVPAINTLSTMKKDITVLSDMSPLQRFLNLNVQFLDNSLESFNRHILESDIIIGSGRTIEQAIFACKPCIVLGARGYGGIITSNNFHQQYESFFQGRVGGHIGEHIPMELFLNDVLDVWEWQQEKSAEITKASYNLICMQFDLSVKRVNTLLKSISNKSTHDEILNSELCISYDFLFMPVSTEKFAIINKVSNKIFCVIEQKEYDIIMHFSEINRVRDVLDQSIYKERPDIFMDFIKTLLTEKILLVQE